MVKIKQNKDIKNPWFKKNKGILKGRLPISWQGYLVLILYLTLNFYSVFYFKLPFGDIQNIMGFFGVLLLSTFIFMVIAVKKTRNENVDF